METRKIFSLSVVLVLALSLAMVLTMALEATPRIWVAPTTIPPFGITNIYIEAYDPPGDPPDVPNDFLYIEVHQVVVRYPGRPVVPGPWIYTEEYMLGTAAAPGITGQKIRIEYGEVIKIPYGHGVGMITIKGNDYYWWRTRKGGNPVYPNERIDLKPLPSPTGWNGKYEADVEGIAYYGASEKEIRLRAFFDIPGFFHVVPEFGLTAAAISLFAYWAISLRKRKLQS